MRVMPTLNPHPAMRALRWVYSDRGRWHPFFGFVKNKERRSTPSAKRREDRGGTGDLKALRP